MALVEVKELTKSYITGKRVINKATFSIEAGECLGLVGESGCGKSTLARCLLRIEPINSGSILYKQIPIERLKESELRPYRKQVQTVFQHPAAALNPKIKIKDSLLDPYQSFRMDLNLNHFSYHSRERYVEKLLEAVELPTNLADRYPHELSGGQQQRVTIARAISIEPKLILFDEPTASLDVLSQGTVLRLLTELRKRLGIAYLFISHDLAAVQQMSQRMMVMKEGDIIDQFHRDQLYAECRHPYTKELISIF